MIDPSHPIAELLQQDDRYPFEAYVFVFDALRFAQEVLEIGTEGTGEPSQETEEEGKHAAERHVSGQELCEAIRLFSLNQYGYMAKTVLGNWGIHKTGDFGEIVFNLIRIGQMRKTSHDRRKDFDDVYNFDVAFRQDFKITLPSED